MEKEEEKINMSPGVHKLRPTGQIQLTACEAQACEIRTVFPFFKWLREKKHKIARFCDTLKLYEIQISVSKNKVKKNFFALICF